MKDVNEFLKEMNQLNDAGSYNQVVEYLNDDVLSKYKNSDLFIERSRAHGFLKEYDQALSYANKSVEIGQNNFRSYNQRGAVLYFKSEYEKALLDFDKAIEIKENPYSYYNRSTIYHIKRDYDKVIDDCNKSINILENNSDAYLSRALALYEKGKLDEAIEDYNKAIFYDDKNDLAYNNRGVALFSKKEYTKALEDYDKVIDLNRQTSRTYRNKGDVFYEIGDFQNALDNYQIAFDLDKSSKFLDNKVKLTREKIEEISLIEQSNAEQRDKNERKKLEEEIENLISRIRNLSKSEVKTVVHYTKVLVAEIYVGSIESKMHYSNAIYMNDPMEGKVLFEYLNDKSIEDAYFRGEKRTETSVYLGSFLPAEENDGLISHEDELVMWRTYGKDENNKEAAGCCVVLSSDFFKEEKKKNEKIALSENNLEGSLLNVIYIKRLKNKKSIANDVKNEKETTIKYLKGKLKDLIKLRNKYKPKDDFYKDIENTIFKQLSTISYLFKSADYQFENEVRIIKYIPRDSDSIKYRNATVSGLPKKKFYIESDNEILPYIKKIYLGPKVENYQEWSLYLDYEVRQRVKEIKIKNPLYPLKPSEIEIIKSDCKFQ